MIVFHARRGTTGRVMPRHAAQSREKQCVAPEVFTPTNMPLGLSATALAIDRDDVQVYAQGNFLP